MGILRRAEKRNKALPEMLRQALQDVVDGKGPAKGWPNNCMCFEPGATSRLGGHINEELASTLRAEMGDNQSAVVYEPTVYDGESITSPINRSNPDAGVCHTLTNGGAARAMLVDKEKALPVENHASDSRVKISEDGICQTLTSTMGTGGGNVPLVLEEKIDVASEKEVNGFSACAGVKAGGISYSRELAPTLSACRHDAAIVFEKPMPDVIAIDGNIIQKGEKARAQGFGINDEAMYTLTATDRHGVAMSMTTGDFMHHDTEKAMTLAARDYKDPQICCYSNKAYDEWEESDTAATLMATGGVYGGGSEVLCQESKYIVRRLTPLECCRLQGMPDWWEKDLEISEPTEEDMAFWRKVFETKKNIDGDKTTKSDKAIKKWLKNPYSDSASYKMWGNGIARPTAQYVLEGVAQAMKGKGEKNVG